MDKIERIVTDWVCPVTQNTLTSYERNEIRRLVQFAYDLIQKLGEPPLLRYDGERLDPEDVKRLIEAQRDADVRFYGSHGE